MPDMRERLVIRCRLCVLPNTRPDTEFVDGICSACISYAARKAVDWEARKRELGDLLERGRNTTGYDCVVGSSGGKDSHWQALQLIGMGARPLLVTASTCHLTGVGRLNIENLKRYATTIEVSPNRMVRATLNRLGLDLVGDISWPEHAGIFTTPLRIAASLGIPLVFYGENPQNQYGGPIGSEQARTMTRRWVSEFGGFLGLRVTDCAGYNGITMRDMADYTMPTEDELERAGIEAHFLGQYMPWNSHRNAEEAHKAGMVQVLPSHGNWWHHENLDNAQTGIHDHAMYRKYGYGRLGAQVAVDVRTGRMTRAQAMELVQWRDGAFPEIYMGLSLDEILARIQITRQQLLNVLDRFTAWELFEGAAVDGRPILKEEA